MDNLNKVREALTRALDVYFKGPHRVSRRDQAVASALSEIESFITTDTRSGKNLGVTIMTEAGSASKGKPRNV